MLRLWKVACIKVQRAHLKIDDTIATGNLRDSFRYKITGFDTNILIP